ncbi:MAG: hypothetical protein DWH80_15955 [Planctomycetota bacterium]|nr:MAG: hypothetical protein DWH80_15955 [Planctomycetota bacterium]
MNDFTENCQENFERKIEKVFYFISENICGTFSFLENDFLVNHMGASDFCPCRSIERLPRLCREHSSSQRSAHRSCLKGPFSTYDNGTTCSGHVSRSVLAKNL